MAEDLNLKQVAARLGVHYMTAYRYVRQGRLAAHRRGTEWRVSADAVAAFEAAGAEPEPVPQVDWAARLVDPLLAGDEATSWMLVDRALAAGHAPADCYLDVIAKAIGIIDERRTEGLLSPAHQPLATAVAMRLAARLGARFRRPGRSKGSVVFGAPVGERHSLPIAIVADVVRLEGYDVLELGADVPAEAFAAAATQATRLAAVGIGITGTSHLDEARATITAIRAVDPTIPVVVGGQAVLNPEVAGVLEADGWAPDGRTAAAVITDLARRRARTVATARR